MKPPSERPARRGRGTSARKWTALIPLLLGWCLLANSSAPAVGSLSSDRAEPLLASSLASWIAHGLWLDASATGWSGDPSESMHVLRRIVQLQPDNPFFRVNAVGILAYDVVADMDPAEREPFISAALSILDEGLRSDPGNPYLNY